jgi:hypothetical protein
VQIPDDKILVSKLMTIAESVSAGRASQSASLLPLSSSQTFISARLFVDDQKQGLINGPLTKSVSDHNGGHDDEGGAR